MVNKFLGTALIIAVTILAVLAAQKTISIFQNPDPYKSHVSLEQSVKQSKFNLVKDIFVESFIIGEESSLYLGRWHALFIVVYEFHYGIDAKDLHLTKVADGNGSGPDEYDIEVRALDIISTRLMAKTYNIDNSNLKNVEKKINEAHQDLYDREAYLAKQRLYLDPQKKNLGLIEESIRDTISNLAKALGQDIVINNVKMPGVPDEIKNLQPPRLIYQKGDMEPLF